MQEFDVVNSNYVEKYYERYLEYKKKNPSYSDDTIITYVNIGLDRPFYNEMENTNLNDGILLICNKYHTLGSNYVQMDGVKIADTYSARAGTSEHQTGLALDVNSVSNSFEYTSEYSWLIKNSYKYGFILRYPKNKTFITGYQYELWHYRYVGEEVAKYIYEHDITYEEYYATFILKG